MKPDMIYISAFLFFVILASALLIHPVLADENTTVPNSTSVGGMEIHTITRMENQAGIIYIARGDDYTLSGAWDPVNNLKKEVSFWLFGSYGSLAPIYDQPVDVNIENNYHVYLKSLQTGSLNAGTFIGVIQFTGKNGIKEIEYDAVNEELSSPFRAVQSVPIRGDSPSGVYTKLLTMIRNLDFCDDTYRLYEIRVEEPWISVDDSQSNGDTKDPEVTLHGETNLGPSNSLIAILDLDKQVTAAKLKEATKPLKIYEYKDANHPRNTWNLTFKTSTLYPGDHEIIVKSLRFNVETSAKFIIRDLWENPTPTPTPVRVIGFPTTEPTPPPIPTPTEVPTPPAVIIQTPQPTTIITTAIPTTVPTPVPTLIIETPIPTETKKMFLNAKPDSPLGKSLSTMPISPIIPITGLIVAFLVLRRRNHE